MSIDRCFSYKILHIIIIIIKFSARIFRTRLIGFLSTIHSMLRCMQLRFMHERDVALLLSVASDRRVKDQRVKQLFIKHTRYGGAIEGGIRALARRSRSRRVVCILAFCANGIDTASDLDLSSSGGSLCKEGNESRMEIR